MANKNTDQAPVTAATAAPPRPPPSTFLGQTKGTWYIYWICAVASIANISVIPGIFCSCQNSVSKDSGSNRKNYYRFQGFDSGIYSIIISDDRFIDYFQVSGARSGVVASMGMFE
jgi:hypothetical protein